MEPRPGPHRAGRSGGSAAATGGANSPSWHAPSLVAVPNESSREEKWKDAAKITSMREGASPG